MSAPKVLVLQYRLPLSKSVVPTDAERFHPMRIPGLLGRHPRATHNQFAAVDIEWGIRRRSGYSQMDDPVAHRGLVQHAFLMGVDTRAICGYKPLRWRQRRAAPLAIPTSENPYCPECWSSIRGPEASVIVVNRYAWGEAAQATSPERSTHTDAGSIHRRRRRLRREELPGIVAVRPARSNSLERRSRVSEEIDQAA